MTKKALKTIAAALALLVLAGQGLFAIGFGYHVLELDVEASIAEGILPSTATYQFNFPVPDLVVGSSTEFAFRLDNGLETRHLRQDPETGDFYHLNGNVPSHTLEYLTFYDEFNLLFRQGFARNRVTIGVQIDGRFENSYESLFFDKSEDGLFWYQADDGTWVERFSSFSGAPELEGGRSVFQTSLSAYFALDFQSGGNTAKKGVAFTSFFRITGPWTPLNDGTADFILSENTLDISLPLWKINRERNRYWCSLVLSNRTVYRYLTGSKVPQYALGGDMDSITAPATEHVVTTETELTFYGPDLGKNTYPALTAYVDLGLSLGKALNSSDDTFHREFVAAGGLRTEMFVGGFFRVYCEWTGTIDPVFETSRTQLLTLGMRFEV